MTNLRCCCRIFPYICDRCPDEWIQLLRNWQPHRIAAGIQYEEDEQCAESDSEFGNICDLQIKGSGFLSEISAQITVNYHFFMPS